MDKHTLESLNRILDHIYDDEMNDYKQAENKKEHIFKDIQLVEAWYRNIIKGNIK